MGRSKQRKPSKKAFKAKMAKLTACRLTKRMSVSSSAIVSSVDTICTTAVLKSALDLHSEATTANSRARSTSDTSPPTSTLDLKCSTGSAKSTSTFNSKTTTSNPPLCSAVEAAPSKSTLGAKYETALTEFLFSRPTPTSRSNSVKRFSSTFNSKTTTSNPPLCSAVEAAPSKSTLGAKYETALTEFLFSRSTPASRSNSVKRFSSTFNSKTTTSNPPLCSAVEAAPSKSTLGAKYETSLTEFLFSRSTPTSRSNSVKRFSSVDPEQASVDSSPLTITSRVVLHLGKLQSLFDGVVCGQCRKGRVVLQEDKRGSQGLDDMRLLSVCTNCGVSCGQCYMPSYVTAQAPEV